MPLFISLPYIQEARLVEGDATDGAFGGPPGHYRPGYVDPNGAKLCRQDRFEDRHIRVPDGINAEAMLANILRFMEPRLSPIVPAGAATLDEIDGHS